MQLLERNLERIEHPSKKDAVYLVRTGAPTPESNDTRSVKRGHIVEAPLHVGAKFVVEYGVGSVGVRANVEREAVFTPFEVADAIKGEVEGGELMTPEQTAAFLANPESLRDEAVKQSVVQALAVQQSLRANLDHDKAPVA